MPPLGVEHTEALAGVYADPRCRPPHRWSRARRRGHRSPGGPLPDRLARARLRLERAGRQGLRSLPRPGRAAPLAAVGEVELGYVIARHAQGRGLATEAARAWLDVALDELGLRRLTAVVHPDNAPSQALATRLGFRMHREDVTPSGVRVLVYERLAG
ncbi:GNAT family N-acetyltransferase [Geodermatophilus africanus]|uniref:GNAT family N-acetyltransferase n=1 Tax=Geodermatophilus africanus TaxID=1137993 RepID=UPI001FCD9FA9|nr:GNAT family N-acetyltransferase [Geodermatophilus africanus]